MKQNIIFQQDWADHILTWDQETAYKFVVALLEYGFYNNDTWEPQNVAVARILDEAKKQLDANREKYEAKAERAKSARGQKSSLKSEQKSSLNSSSIDIDIDNISSNEDIKDIVGKPDDIKVIVDYLNERTGSHFKANTAETKKSIKARLKEGYTVDDFKRVIDSKVKDWADDDRMKDYLRPQTLFRPANFEAYLNAANRPRQPDKKNKFNNYQQNEYDFDELERQLMKN